MTSPQPALEPDHPGLTPTEDAVVAALATFLLQAQLVAATAVPLYLLLRLTSLGVDKRAARAAGRLVHAAPLPTSTMFTGTAIAQTREAEARIRATYWLKAAQRITRALTHGADMFTAIRQERRFYHQHKAAADNRERAARAVDTVAQKSPWMKWNAVIDSRTTADCRALDGRVFTIDQPLTDATGRPLVPGAVHSRCRCFATAL